MGLVYYNRKEDIGTNAGGIAQIVSVPQLTLSQSYYDSWQNNAIQLEDGTTSHYVGLIGSPGGQGDWSASFLPDESKIYKFDGNNPTIWYFNNGLNFTFFAKYFDLTTRKIIRTVDFCKITKNQNNTLVFDGFSGDHEATTDGYPPASHNSTLVEQAYVMLCKTDVNFYSVEKTVPCYYFVAGYIRVSNDDIPIPYFIPSVGLIIEENLFSSAVSDDQGGVPQEPEGGEGSYQLNGENLDFGTADGLNADTGGGGLAAPTAKGLHAYEVDLVALTNFINNIYGSDDFSFSSIWQDFKNSQHDPLSGVLGCFMIPSSPSGSAVGYIKLSGQTFTIGGSCRAINRFGETGTSSLNIKPYYNSYLDYAPYTSISLYLPFIGQVSINTNEVMGGNIAVKYRIDFCTGACVAYITCTDKNGRTTYYQFSGNCAAGIPVAAQDGGAMNRIMGVFSSIGGLASVGAGNIFGIKDIISGVSETMEPRTNTRHSGSFSGGAGCIGGLYPFVVINRPKAAVPENYTNLMGGMAITGTKVKNFSGYTEFQEVNLASVSATQAIKDDILAKLKGGVIL